MTMGKICWIIVFVLCVSCPVLSKEVYVNSLAAGANDGTSWHDAYVSLKTALPGVSDTVIHVAEGVYSPGASESSTFSVGGEVTILGGYVAEIDGEPVDPNLMERDPNVYLTILSGDVTGDDILVDTQLDPLGLRDEEASGTHVENNNIVVTVNTANVVLDGLVITQGSSSTASGGGIYVTSSGSVTVNDCVISRNYASYGGAISNSGVAVCNRCVMEYNGCYYSGGAINNRSDLTLNDCVIARNVSVNSYGGGVWNYGSSDVTCEATGCVIEQNRCVGSWSNTGGIGGRLDDNDLTIHVNKSVIRYNCTDAHGAGVMIWKSQSYHTGEGVMNVSHCLIEGNRGERGGGGGCCVQYGVTMNLTNCTVTGNHHVIGSGLYACESGSVYHVKNCIVWGNDGAVDSDEQIRQNTSATFDVDYTDIGNSTDTNSIALSSGTGNIDVNPYFVQSGYWDDNGTPADTSDDVWVEGDYHLLPDSLCINAGDPAITPEPDETDIDGDARVRLGRVDMGADEAGSHPADMDESGIVDLIDHSIFFAAWGSSAGDANWDQRCNIAEPQDNTIDILDLSAYCSEWLWQAPWY